MNDQATEAFEQGTRDRQYSDEFVRVTVTLATVLLLIAISQRFKTRVCGLGCYESRGAAVLSGLSHPYSAPSIERLGLQLLSSRATTRFAKESRRGFVLGENRDDTL